MKFIRLLLPLLLNMYWLTASAQTTLSGTTAAEGPQNWIIENVQCSGNEITSCSLIEKDLYLRAGDKVNEEEIANATLRLKTLGLFYDVQISLKKGASRGQVIVVIDVVERSANYVNISGAIDTKTNWYQYNAPNSLATVALGNRNLFGSGKRLEVAISKFAGADSRSFNAIYEDPNLFGSSKYFGSLTANATENTYQLLDSKVKSVSSNYGLSLGRRIFDFSYLKVLLAEYSYSIGRYPLPFSSGNHQFDVEYGWDTRDDIFMPTSGSLFSFGVTTSDNHEIEYRFYNNLFFHQSLDQTVHLHSDYFFNVVESIDYRSDSLEDATNTNLQLIPSIFRYFTIHRQGALVPDRLKAFGSINAFQHYDSYHSMDPSFRANIGISYLIDTFGQINLTLGIGDIK